MNSRPLTGSTSSTVNMLGETYAPTRRSASPMPESVGPQPRVAAMPLNNVLWSRQSSKLRGATVFVREPERRLVSHNIVSSSGRSSESGRSTTPFTTLKMAVLAPMPSARVSMTTAVNPGVLINVRTANRMSCTTDSMSWASLRSRRFLCGSRRGPRRNLRSTRSRSRTPWTTTSRRVANQSPGSPFNPRRRKVERRASRNASHKS